MKQTTVLKDTDKSFAALADILSSKTIKLTPEVAFRCLDMIDKVIGANSLSEEKLHSIKVLADGDAAKELKLFNEYSEETVHITKDNWETLRLSLHAMFDKIDNDGKHKIHKVVADLDLLAVPTQSDMFDQELTLVTDTNLPSKKRADNKTITVLLDGTPIKGVYQKDIFKNTLKKMGLRRIADSDYRFRKKPLISRNKKDRDATTMEQFKDGGSYWTIMPTNSWEKILVLNDLGEELGY
ncbi:MAG: hypothetical protein DRQ40_02680, partial [Gammaproteobacteria bacterium]